MRQALFSRTKYLFGASTVALWLSACAPDLSANEAPRCDDSQLCELGELCYRGFCIPQEIAPMPVARGAAVSLSRSLGGRSW